jgi:hypothetical protein
MEPKNRPYVDPATEPGDAGTEPWADDLEAPKAEVPSKRPVADPAAPAAEDAAIEGSPADHFLTEDAVSARNEDPEEPASDG